MSKIVKLIPYNEKFHLKLLEKWLTDEKLMRGWDMPPFWEDKVKDWTQEGKVILMIADKLSNVTVGFVNFYDWDKKKGVASRGTLIDSKYQNMGYGKAAIVATNEFAFKKMGLQKIELYVADDNHISRHITEKMGYKFVRHDRKKNRYYYEMLKE